MSILGKALKAVGKVVKPAAKALLATTPVGRVLTAATTIGGITAVGSGALKALPAVRTLPGIGRAISPAMRTAGKVVGTAATGYAIYDAAGNLIGSRHKRRRINPMNYRALKRAARRIKSSKKLVKLIESVSGGHHRRSSSSKSCGPKSRCNCK